jgi:competence protein ComEA
MQEHAKSITLLTLASGLLLVVGLLAKLRTEPREPFAASEPVTFRIDPNRADAPSLCLLPGVGPGIAERIVNDREANGPFASADQMRRVPYVGEKTATAIEPWVVFPPKDR